VLFLLLILSFAIVQPASSETPVLKLKGYDLAPKIIYLGDSYSDNTNDVLMLQITFNTTSEEGITISTLILHRMGQSSDSGVTAIHIYEDVNYNNEFESGLDLKISSSTFELGKAELTMGKTITKNHTLSIFVTLDISGDANSNGTLGVDIPDPSFIETNDLAFIEFEFPICSKNSTIYLDTDGDSNPDIFDPDDDNDRYTDDIEILSGTDTKDAKSMPMDTDSDYVPDSIDTDDDNDGVPDKYDDFPKNEHLQRDYTVVILYLVIAVVLIMIMIFVLRKRKIDISKLEIADKDEFKIDKKSKRDLEDEILEDEDLLDDL
jgi:hypothetical protein